MQAPLIMGIVNVTPDSFSDGGRFFDARSALQQIDTLIHDGADIIDLGAESTRPGAPPVPADEEWARLLPVLQHLDRLNVRVSVDTYKPEIMRRLLDHRVDILNDIRGGADDVTLKRLASAGKTYLAMHMHRDPQSMQTAALDGPEAMVQLDRFYRGTVERLHDAGFAHEKIWLDPGIGFGKNDRANLYLIRDAMQRAQRLPIVLGVSRKSFIGRLLDIERPEDRDPPTKMLELAFLMAGVKAVRTHQVKPLVEMRDLLKHAVD